MDRSWLLRSFGAACGVAIVLAAIAAACGDDDSTASAPEAGTPAPPPPPPMHTQAPPPGGNDAASDAGLDADASVDPATYNDFRDASSWVLADINDLDGGPAGPNNGFFGTTFDGRYIYLVGDNGSPSARYDTTAPFTSASSWETYQPNGFFAAGGAFDGRYVYLVPQSIGGAVTTTRFDSHGAFKDAGSWSTFNLANLDAGPITFSGATFDGRAILYAAQSTGANPARGARFDTDGGFTDAASWQTKLPPGGPSDGAIFDGRYVYFPPSVTGVVSRYDTTMSYADPASWTTFDVGTTDAGTDSFYGGAFDGRYVYFAPYGSGVAARYDTKAPFQTATSWLTVVVPTTAPAPGRYYGAAFDGRYVYLLPGSYHRLERYDTRQPFTASSSWSELDLSTLANIADIGSAVFDGRYLYLVPIESGTTVFVARFDAKNPPAMPNLPAFHGSFY